MAKDRLNKFRGCVGRMWQLRAKGANAKLMTRAAGTASVMYGCDIQGVSTTLLNQQASTIARAAAPPGAGKNPTVTLYVLDGHRGTLDPHFEAHSLLVKHVALAWWEDWIPPKSLSLAFDHVRAKYGSNSPSWNSVAGPTAALWVSLRRVNWSWKEAHLLVDDLGREWDMRCDPPAAISNAMADTVRRHRLEKVASHHPNLIPNTPDIGASKHGASDIILEFSNILAPLAGGKVAKLVDTPEFLRKHASSLLSAAVGGQWPQAKKAAVPKWEVKDDRCQLCLTAKGTLKHRLVCRCNVPAGGWSNLPAKAELAERTIGPVRSELLATTGLLTLRLPALPPRLLDTLHWGVKPPDDLPMEVTWYIDGSRMNPRRKQLATCGFALAAVTRDGDLCAWGWGVPPAWCDSAAAAEAWALCTVLRISPGHTKIVTDCLGLVETASNGTAAAVTSRKHLARVWSNIANSLDGRIDSLFSNKALVWMPAHLTSVAIGQANKSNDSPVTARDWRANRLVDGLAKLAADDGATPVSHAKLVCSAEALVRHRAAQLAVATYNANNHKIEVVKEDGTVGSRTIRDSQQIATFKNKMLRPLQIVPPAPCAATLGAGTIGGAAAAGAARTTSDSDSDSVKHMSKKQRRTRDSALRRRQSARRHHDAIADIVRRPRLNQQEAAVDCHRRKQAAKSLISGAVEPPSPVWDGFLSMGQLAATPPCQGELPPGSRHEVFNCDVPAPVSCCKLSCACPCSCSVPVGGSHRTSCACSCVPRVSCTFPYKVRIRPT